MSKSLVRETNYRVINSVGYRGTCNACGSPVHYDDTMIVVEIKEFDDRYVVVPVDIFSCPHCYKTIVTMEIYKQEVMVVSVEKEG